MDTDEGNIEDKACESSMVVVTNTTVHLRSITPFSLISSMRQDALSI